MAIRAVSFEILGRINKINNSVHNIISAKKNTFRQNKWKYYKRIEAIMTYNPQTKDLLADKNSST